jgi:2-hydroxy-4-carboxymuconate semialdehyde hemiacetal dehydrogenase
MMKPHEEARMGVGVCIVGYGGIAKYHAGILREAGAELDAVVGRVPGDAAAFASEFGFRHHTTDLGSALARSGCRVVIVTSPNDLHYAHARQALLAGKDVLCEIPLAMSYREGAELVDLAKQQGRTLMVAHSMRFQPALVWLHDQIASGALHLRHVLARMLMFRLVNIGWTGRQRSWTDSILWHQGGHLVDCALWMLGTEQVSIQGNLAPADPRTKTPLDVDVLLRSQTGQLANISLSFLFRGGTPDLECAFICEEEAFQYGKGVLRNSTGVVMEEAPAGGDYLLPSWEAQDREFLAALEAGRAPKMSGADALMTLAVLQEVQDGLVSRVESGSGGITVRR